ncbi:MAG: hypothetical protein ACYST0_01015, partial [Planctomycetota bacterium]|jgi:hypothetical protein
MNTLASFSAGTTVAIALLASTICGQSNPNAGLLVGNVGPIGPSSSLAGELYTQAVDSNCAAPKKSGNSAPLAMAFYGGGTAYDAARQAVWVSDGRVIALQQVSNAKVSCQLNAKLSGTYGKANFVSGLAHCNKRKQLIQMEMVVGTSSNSLVFRFYDTSACPPKLLNTTCSFAIPSTMVPGVAHGLAYDEARDLIFFTMSGSGFAGWTSSVNFINYSVACLGAKPGSFPVPLFSQCGGANTPVTAMAYNSCTQILYVTEGTVMLKMDISNLSKPVNLNASTPCCKFNVQRKAWAGLAIVPNSVIKSVGTSCLSSGCPSCSNMTLGFTGGDLALGNQDLAIQITGAPAGGTAGFYISLGNCVIPGLSLPGLCGAIHTPISAGQPLFIGNFSLSSGSGCTGTMKIPTPMPSDRAVCNTTICSQFLIRCPSGGSAGGLTNAIEFRVGG